MSALFVLWRPPTELQLILLGGYRPSIDDSGFVYLVTLVRNDVWKEVVEHYQIKVRTFRRRFLCKLVMVHGWAFSDAC